MAYLSGIKKIFNGLINKSRHLEQLVEKNALLIVIVFFILLVLIKILLSLNFYAPFVYGDEIVYDSLAHNLLEGKLYPNFGPSVSPGYPLFLSIAYIISDDRGAVYHIMLIISAIVTTSIIFPAYFILKKYCSTIISIIGSLATATLPQLNYNSFTLMSETLFVPLFLFSVWFLMKSYETNDKKWEILASLSVVYLYVTRSNGLAMVIAFILAFIYYLAVNSRENKIVDLLKKKSFLIVTFIVFLSSWVVISTYVTDIHDLYNSNTNPNYSLGSSYNIVDLSSKGSEAFMSMDSLFRSLKYFINMIDYTFLSSYSFLYIMIMCIVIFVLNKMIVYKSPLSISVVYVLSTLVGLITSTVFFIIYVGGTEAILGRYVDPIIPAIIILGVIGIVNLNDRKLIGKKASYLIFASYILTILFILFTLIYDNTIIRGFMTFVNNPGLYSYTFFYGSDYISSLFSLTNRIIPAVRIILYFMMLLGLICLSIYNRRYLSLLLVFIILSSIILSINLYNFSMLGSDYRKDNGINNFLNNNTNKETLYIIDQTNSSLNARNELYMYGFWNKGDIAYTQNSTLSGRYENRTVFLISTESLPYKEVARDKPFILYTL